MKIQFTSDLHEKFPLKTDCDVLCISGDVFSSPDLNRQTTFWFQYFIPWAANLDCRVIMTAGNHDRLIFNYRKKISGLGLPKNVSLLLDEEVEWDGLKFYGCPWTRTFYDWYFMMDEDELEKHMETIRDCDILLTHSPPYMILDGAPRPYGIENVGSKTLRDLVFKMKPMYHNFGHIHEAVGVVEYNGTVFINSSCRSFVVNLRGLGGT